MPVSSYTATELLLSARLREARKENVRLEQIVQTMTNEREDLGKQLEAGALDPDALVSLDEIAADLCYLMGRASSEGHEAGQRLAYETRQKMNKALSQLRAAQPDRAPGQGWPQPDDCLPCDVRLPPYTTITKGCRFSTLFASIKQRIGKPVAWEGNEFSRSPPASCAPADADQVRELAQAIRDLSSAFGNLAAVEAVVEAARKARLLDPTP